MFLYEYLWKLLIFIYNLFLFFFVNIVSLFTNTLSTSYIIYNYSIITYLCRMLRLFSTGYEYRNNKNVIYFSEYNNMVISKGKTAFFMLIKVDKYTSPCRIGNTQHY